MNFRIFPDWERKAWSLLVALLFRLEFSVIRISRDFIKMFSFRMIVAVGEVARVTEELAIIDHQTRDMASQNYQIFVQSAQTANLIKKSVRLFIV
jgi:hypothetical protein